MNESEMQIQAPMQLERSNTFLQSKVNQLIKEKKELIEVIKGNVEGIKVIESKINAKEKELMGEIERLTNENYLLKQEVVMVNKERENNERLFRESENMKLILKGKVSSLSKLIIENEKIRHELSLKLNDINSNNTSYYIKQILPKINEVHKEIHIPLLKINNSDPINTIQPITTKPNHSIEFEQTDNNSNCHNQGDKKHIWNIISDIKSHISQEQFRLNYIDKELQKTNQV